MLDPDTVDHVARLARLDLPPEERAAVAGELRRILAWVDRLREVDVTGIPAWRPDPGDLPPLRDDVPEPSLPRAEALRNAPETEGPFFRVPPVLEGGGDGG